MAKKNSKNVEKNIETNKKILKYIGIGFVVFAIFVGIVKTVVPYDEDTDKSTTKTETPAVKNNENKETNKDEKDFEVVSAKEDRASSTATSVLKVNKDLPTDKTNLVNKTKDYLTDYLAHDGLTGLIQKVSLQDKDGKEFATWLADSKSDDTKSIFELKVHTQEGDVVESWQP